MLEYRLQVDRDWSFGITHTYWVLPLYQSCHIPHIKQALLADWYLHIIYKVNTVIRSASWLRTYHLSVILKLASSHTHTHIHTLYTHNFTLVLSSISIAIPTMHVHQKSLAIHFDPYRMCLELCIKSINPYPFSYHLP